jgi:hypothetical protein
MNERKIKKNTLPGKSLKVPEGMERNVEDSFWRMKDFEE